MVNRSLRSKSLIGILVACVALLAMHANVQKVSISFA